MSEENRRFSERTLRVAVAIPKQKQTADRRFSERTLRVAVAIPEQKQTAKRRFSEHTLRERRPYRSRSRLQSAGFLSAHCASGKALPENTYEVRKL